MLYGALRKISKKMLNGRRRFLTALAQQTRATITNLRRIQHPQRATALYRRSL